MCVPRSFSTASHVSKSERGHEHYYQLAAASHLSFRVCAACQRGVFHNDARDAWSRRRRRVWQHRLQCTRRQFAPEGVCSAYPRHNKSNVGHGGVRAVVSECGVVVRVGAAEERVGTARYTGLPVYHGAGGLPHPSLMLVDAGTSFMACFFFFFVCAFVHKPEKMTKKKKEKEKMDENRILFFFFH